MSALKDTLCLLAILIAYGIAERMDDDVVMPDQAPRTVSAVYCLTGKTLTTEDLEAQTMDQAFAQRSDRANSEPSNDDAPCTSHAL